MVKVWCSEMLDLGVDERAALRGGRLRRDYPPSGYWRDARVNRIFEGHQRDQPHAGARGGLISPGHEGRTADLPEGHGLMAELTAGLRQRTGGWVPGCRGSHGPGRQESALASRGRVQKFGQSLEEQQEILALRRRGDGDLRPGERRRSHPEASPHPGRGSLPSARGRGSLLRSGRHGQRSRSPPARLLAAVEEGDMLRTHLAALKRFAKRDAIKHHRPRRQVAQAAIEAGGIPWASPGSLARLTVASAVSRAVRSALHRQDVRGGLAASARWPRRQLGRLQEPRPYRRRSSSWRSDIRGSRGHRGGGPQPGSGLVGGPGRRVFDLRTGRARDGLRPAPTRRSPRTLAIFHNAAGIAFLRGKRLYFGGTFVMPSSDFTGADPFRAPSDRER